MAMQPIWVLVADEGRARFLERRAPDEDLREIDEITDAGARADNADFRHDAYGRRSGGDPRMGGSAMSSAGEEKLDHEAEGFARRVAEKLAVAQRQHRFGELRLVAAPRFLGRLRKVLDPQVSQAVVDELDKDLLQLDQRELTQRLFKH